MPCFEQFTFKNPETFSILTRTKLKLGMILCFCLKNGLKLFLIYENSCCWFIFFHSILLADQRCRSKCNMCLLHRGVTCSSCRLSFLLLRLSTFWRCTEEDAAWLFNFLISFLWLSQLLASLCLCFFWCSQRERHKSTSPCEQSCEVWHESNGMFARVCAVLSRILNVRRVLRWFVTHEWCVHRRATVNLPPAEPCPAVTTSFALSACERRLQVTRV